MQHSGHLLEVELLEEQAACDKAAVRVSAVAAASLLLRDEPPQRVALHRALKAREQKDARRRLQRAQRRRRLLVQLGALLDDRRLLDLRGARLRRLHRVR